MRKITTLLLIGLAFMYAAEGFAQRGIGTNLPNRSSVLHLESKTRGLLIPRVALETTDVADPISAPANSLLVYNTTTTPPDSSGDDVIGEGLTGVRPGYYYWKSDDPTADPAITGGQWIPLLNTAGNNIEIDDNGVVSVKPGENPGDVLVTVLSDPTDSTSELTTEWMSFEEFIKVIGENGVTVVPVTDPVTGIKTFTVELGGVLNKETVITTEDNKFEIRTGTGTVDIDGNFTGDNNGKEFFISNLTEIEVNDDGKIVGAIDPDDIFTEQFDVLIVDKDTGLVQRVSVEDLLKDAVAVKNGLHYDPIDGFIKLGGDLTQDTEIKLQESNDFIITRGETLDTNESDVTNPGEFKIVGLEEVDAANNIMVVDENNVVKTVRRVISKEIAEDFTINTANWPEYSPYVHEVNIKVTDLSTNDINLILPDPTDAEGQVINVKLNIPAESQNYLMIKKDAADPDISSVTWGALRFQGWTLKVIKDEWLVVSSN